MVNYPTILGLPQEDIDRQLYVGVLGLESRVKALENKPKPTPTQTGTVTVTGVIDDGETQYPLVSNNVVLLSTEQVDWADLDPTIIVASCSLFDEQGVGQLTTIQGQSTDIPFGNYYLSGVDVPENIQYEYSGTLVVDGDEEVTITLTPIEEGD